MGSEREQELFQEIRQTVEEHKKHNDRMDGIAAGFRWAEDAEDEQLEPLAELLVKIVSSDASKRFLSGGGEDQWSAAERIVESITGRLGHKVSRQFWALLQRVPEKTVSPDFIDGFIMGVSIVLVENTDEAELSESAAD